MRATNEFLHLPLCTGINCQILNFGKTFPLPFLPLTQWGYYFVDIYPLLLLHLLLLNDLKVPESVVFYVFSVVPKHPLFKHVFFNLEEFLITCSDSESTSDGTVFFEDFLVLSFLTILSPISFLKTINFALNS